MIIPNYYVKNPSNIDDWHWIYNATWESSDPADNVLCSLGLTNCRGFQNIVNRYVKPLATEFVDKLPLIITSITGIPAGSIISKLSIFENSVGEKLFGEIKLPFLVPDEIDIVALYHENGLQNGDGFHEHILLKRLFDRLIERFGDIETGNFSSTIEAKQTYTAATSLVDLIRRQEMEFWGFPTPDHFFLDERVHTFFEASVKRSLRDRRKIVQICRFLNTIEPTTDEIVVQDYISSASIVAEQNKQKTTNKIAVAGVIAGIIAALS